MHGSSQRRGTLTGGDSGVFLGIERPDWAFVQPPSARGSVYSVTGDNISVAAGRISFALGLQGPCSSVDTVCSSALAALQSAVLDIESAATIQSGYRPQLLNLALAVSLKLTPAIALGSASAGMLSVDGRCKTMDSRANGYARSEGVCAQVVKSGKHMSMLLLCGSAVRQDGRSASLTAPNGSAQRVLLLAALGSTTLADIRDVEAHGTGTPLGDPTEAGALAAVHGKRATPLVVGSAKANVGHSEAVSGQVGMLRVKQILEGSTSSGNAQLFVLNPLVGERLSSSSGFVLPVQRVSSDGVCAVPKVRTCRTAGAASAPAWRWALRTVFSSTAQPEPSASRYRRRRPPHAGVVFIYTVRVFHRFFSRAPARFLSLFAVSMTF